MAEIPDAVRVAAHTAAHRVIEGQAARWYTGQPEAVPHVVDAITDAVLAAVAQRCAVLELPDTVTPEEADEVAAAYAACARAARAMAQQALAALAARTMAQQAAPEVTG